MTSFNKALFTKSGDYAMYEGKFVARFKHMPGNRAGFLKFLCKHFTVEEYFAAREASEAGQLRGLAPVEILEAKGYVPSHILKWLKEGKLKDWKGFGYEYWKAKN